MSTLRTDTSPREKIAGEIAEKRKRALRYSVTDQRRIDLDEECDELVSDWLAAPDAEAR